MLSETPAPDPLGTVETAQPAGFDEMLREVRELHDL
jgi:hypothetical protein